jgi:hypothetical protein
MSSKGSGMLCSPVVSAPAGHERSEEANDQRAAVEEHVACGRITQMSHHSNITVIAITTTTIIIITLSSSSSS